MTTVVDTLKVDSRTQRASGAEPPPGPSGGSGGPNAFYEKRKPIFSKMAHGRWRTIKWLLLVATLSVYYLLPWMRWNRGAGMPNQAILVDLDHARFYFFFIELWPQEVYFFTGLLVVAALALFLVTALFGRLWCGFACPQTVWTDLFVLAERLFEGDRNARMRLEAAPWSFDKIWRRLAKHSVWLAIAVLTGGAWVFYFHDAPTLAGQLVTGSAPWPDYLWIAILAFTTYSLAGGMREQVCTYMCPWPRIQGAMLDAHSLQVTYRADRGEPRGPHKTGATWEGRGDCIECRQCVVVCPMGIDIREGSQLECINCGLCIDACDEVMDKVDRPQGLIAYDTDAAVQARTASCKPQYKYLRSRTVFYGAALAIVGSVMLYGLLIRPTVALDVIRDRNPTFVRLSNGDIRNGYTLKIMNRSDAAATFDIAFAGPQGARLRGIGVDHLGSDLQARLDADGQAEMQVFVTAPADPERPLSVPSVFKVTSAKRGVQTKTVFLSGDQGQ